MCLCVCGCVCVCVWVCVCVCVRAVQVSSVDSENVRAHLVRVISADANPSGPGILEEDLSDIFSVIICARSQAVHKGSYGRVKGDARILCHELLKDGFAFAATVCPSLPSKVMSTEVPPSYRVSEHLRSERSD